MGNKMKGLGYELIVFIVAFIAVAIMWTVMTYSTDMLFPMFQNMSTNSTTVSRIGQVSDMMYVSLFFLFVIGVAWVWKTSHGQGAIE